MTIIKRTLAGSAIALAVAAPAMAQAADATAATDLNVRSGPGAWYESVGVIPAGEMATIEGCLDGYEWCEVSYDGTEGWSYAPYLTVQAGDNVATIDTQPEQVEIKTVTYVNEEETDEDKGVAAIAGGTTGALIAYALGGPTTAIVASGLLGSAGAAEVVEPTTETMTYIESNPVEPVNLSGEIVVGAGIPAEIVTYETPQEGLRYLNINGQYVAIDAETNAIVRIAG